MRWIALLVGVATLAAGCGSSAKHAASSTAPPPFVLPQARTPDEWALRVVNRLLRPLNKDLQVVNGFSNQQILFFITTQNQTTLRILRQRLGDLAQCSSKLVAIGPPPAGRPPLRRVNGNFVLACARYVKLAQLLQQATVDLSSGRTDEINAGKKLIRSARPSADAASSSYIAAVRVAQTLPEFRRAGLKPSL